MDKSIIEEIQGDIDMIIGDGFSTVGYVGRGLAVLFTFLGVAVIPLIVGTACGFI